MKLFLFILGSVLILVGILWYIIFIFKKKKMFEQYADKELSNYQDDDIIPEDIVKMFVSKGIVWLLKVILINTVFQFIIIFCRFNNYACCGIPPHN